MEERHQSHIEPTLGDLATEYLERHAVPNKRPTSLRVDRQMIDNIIRLGIGKESWHYSKSTNQMTGKVSQTACLASENKLEFPLSLRWGGQLENSVC